MRKSTIKLTKTEFDFVNREEYPKLKQAVIQKLSQRFDALGATLQQELSGTKAIADRWKHPHFKTTRGENYQGLPYVVVDFPKITGKDFDLICRTMFWWGKYFSLNVIMRSEAFNLKALSHAMKDPAFKKVKVYTGDDLWQQDLTNEHFVKVHSLDSEGFMHLMKDHAYVKLSLKVNFKKWDELEERAVGVYGKVLGAL